MIHGAGLAHYYDLQRNDIDRAALPASPRFSTYAEFDDPEFQRLHARVEGDHRRIELYLEGVHCAACVWLVERLPDIVEGAVSARLDFGRSVASVTWEPQRVALSKVVSALDRFGYVPHPYRSADRRALARREERAMLIRLGVAGAVAGNTMLMGVALYAGATSDPAIASFLRWLSLGVSIPAVFWSGQTFFRGAWAGLRARTLHMDVPVSLAIITAIGASIWDTTTGVGGVYFDSVTMLIFLLLSARWVQFRALRASTDASELLFSLAPSTARLVASDGSSREVPVETILTNQVVEIRAGESAPVDGTVLQGSSRLDNALLTGESLPVEVHEGDEVSAGAVNLQARLLVRVVAAGENTRVGRLVAAVQAAQRRRAPIVQLADRLAVGFVVGVLALSVASGALWWSHGAQVVVERVVAMLVVTCPCALGLATPLAIAHSLGAAARIGIFVKGADTIEALTRIRTVLLDKTGTLTQGRVALTRFDGSPQLSEKVAAIEAHSSHPLAKAVLESRSSKVPMIEAIDVTDTAGGGVRGRVGGEAIAVGNAAYLATLGCSVPEVWRKQADDVARSDGSPVLVAVDGVVCGLMVFGDALREDAVESVASLRKLGLNLGILSGDHPGVVARVARQLGINADAAHGAVTPEGKLNRVEGLMQGGTAVAMVGDGVNDAGALAAARVGIAVRGGAEISLASADVFLTRGGLAPAVELFHGARKTLFVIHRGLAISMIYNLVGAGLALAGLIDPLAAAILMPVSSLSVVLSSMGSTPFSRKPAVPGNRPLLVRGEEVAA